MTLRRIDPAPFGNAAGDLSGVEPGAAPQLQWIEIGKLAVDPAYQRDIHTTGRKNVIKIAREFQWAKFAPVVVAPIEGGLFAVVDGQHRTTAAALVGITSVPCQVTIADRNTQAAAFAAINANVTEMSPMQLRAAKVAAGDAEAVRLNNVCQQAGVTILRYPVQATKQKVGDTMSAGQLYRLLRKFGDDTLMVALSCITRTRDGYPGMVRAQLVHALCVCLEAEPEWSESPKLLKAVGRVDLAQSFRDAWKEASAGSGGGVISALVDVLAERIGNSFDAIKGKAA